MSRRLRRIGSNSGHSGCPTLYEDEEGGNVVVPGDLVTDPDELSETHRRFVAGEDLRRESDDDWSRNRGRRTFAEQVRG